MLSVFFHVGVMSKRFHGRFVWQVIEYRPSERRYSQSGTPPLYVENGLQYGKPAAARNHGHNRPHIEIQGPFTTSRVWSMS
jgi:hypothetical protein